MIVTGFCNEMYNKQTVRDAPTPPYSSPKKRDGMAKKREIRKTAKKSKTIIYDSEGSLSRKLHFFEQLVFLGYCPFNTFCLYCSQLSITEKKQNPLKAFCRQTLCYSRGSKE